MDALLAGCIRAGPNKTRERRGIRQEALSLKMEFHLEVQALENAPHSRVRGAPPHELGDRSVREPKGQRRGGQRDLEIEPAFS